jgi:hypothetical protein
MEATTIYNEKIWVFEVLGTSANTTKGFIHTTKLFYNGQSLYALFNGEAWKRFSLCEYC